MNHSRPVIFSVMLLVGLILARAMSSSGAKPDSVNSRAALPLAATAVSPALTGPVSGQAYSSPPVVQGASSTWQPAGFGGAGAFTTSNKSGIYISHDAGLTWQHLPSTFTNTITFRRFRTLNAIAPDPAHQGFILSGSRENGIWRTMDGGNTGLPTSATVKYLAVGSNDPQDGGSCVLYAAVGVAGVYTSAEDHRRRRDLGSQRGRDH